MNDPRFVAFSLFVIKHSSDDEDRFGSKVPVHDGCQQPPELAESRRFPLQHRRVRP